MPNVSDTGLLAGSAVHSRFSRPGSIRSPSPLDHLIATITHSEVSSPAVVATSTHPRAGGVMDGPELTTAENPLDDLFTTFSPVPSDRSLGPQGGATPLAELCVVGFSGVQ